MTEGRLSGRVAVVTGAATGVGRATAFKLAEEGAALALTDLQGEPLAAVATQLASRGTDVVHEVGDVVQEGLVAGLIDEAESRFGRVDVLVNNVGIVILKSLLETTAEDFDRLMSVNCYSQLLTIQAVVPAMRRAGGGSIVNVASVGAFVALPNVSAYCPSKSAVLGLTRAAAAELAPDIRVNAVCPGGIDTDMARVHLASFDDKEAAMRKLTGRQMIPRYARPEEIAAVISFLASDEASFVTGASYAAEAGHSAW
jgi:NAD(P)-dependent dehydrogenase (short-subunit alcohol dehydrogenase family)